MKNELDLTTLAAEMTGIINTINALKAQRKRSNVQHSLLLLKKKHSSPHSVAEISFFAENTIFEDSQLTLSFNQSLIGNMAEQKYSLTPPKRSNSPLVFRPIRISIDAIENECRSPIQRPSPKVHEKIKSPNEKTASPYSMIGPR